MNKNGMIFCKTSDTPYNGETFKTALGLIKTKCSEMSIADPIFIMDNARIHHYSGLESLIQDLNLKVEYLPPYSPFLNPIENCFSKWKNFVIMGKANCESALNMLIDRGFD